MLTPEYLEFCTDDLLKLYDELDNSILEIMARQIVNSSAVTDTVAWEAERLQESGMLYDDIVAKVAEKSGLIESEVEAMFKNAGVETIQADNEIYSAMGLTPTGIKQSAAMTQALKAGLQKTMGNLKNLTMTTAVTAQNAYIDACNLAYQQVLSGTLSHTEAVRLAVKRAAAQSTTVLYPSGHVDQLDVAIRRACLTGINQTCSQIQLSNAADMGCNLVEITAHGGARPSHAEWQGKVYMINGHSAKYRNLYEATGYGTGPGLCGWNCRHNFFPYFEGSKSAYSKKELNDWSDPELYERTQKQRAYERVVRATRRELSGYNAAMEAASSDADYAALKQEFDKASVKLKKQETRLKQFCEENGLTYDSSRVQSYYGKNTAAGFGKSVSQKAVWANRKVLQNQLPDGIIQIDERFDVHSDKISKYLLKPGAKHSGEFFDVGYSELYPKQLYDDISKGFDMEKAVEKKAGYNGSQTFNIYMELGVSEKKQFRTSWQIDSTGGKPRLITAHRKD